MLQMKCTECKELITSPLLPDLEQVTCNHCQALIPVKDVMVSANGFTYYCTDLKKRLPHYKSLLKSFILEREQMEKDQKATKERKRSLDKTIEALKSFLASARNHCRIHFNDEQFLQYRSDAQIEIGKLINISMSGACIESMMSITAPRQNTALTIMFSLPVSVHVFCIDGVIRWANDGLFGISFKTLRPEDRALLWEHIATLSLGYVPQQRVNACASAT
ncbi:PilZ domain-containing protein [Malonomonas rubra]|uniref:PilZ domain-containing protein n=1 Tax=Malonomonas rubra TaxID=57040 RepID=UPI0026F285E2|nr:PilZ domain-containing protein [Malonomonas rubra]